MNIIGVEIEPYDAWLSDLVLVWRRVAKENDSIPNLFDLSAPTQIYACHVPESDNISKLSIVICHDPEVPDLLVKTVRFSDEHELAERIDSIETEFGIVGEATFDIKVDGDVKIPAYGLMTKASLALNDCPKGKRGYLQSPIELIMQLAIRVREPMASMWVARVSVPLPERDEVVQFVRGHFKQESDRQSMAVKDENSTQQVIVTHKVESQCGYATYPHPHIYWGDPDGPLPSARISGYWKPKADAVCRCEGDGFVAWVFSNGRIVTSLCEATAALKLANLFFSTLARSGIESHEVAEDELIAVSNLDKVSGRSGGSNYFITPEKYLRESDRSTFVFSDELSHNQSDGRKSSSRYGNRRIRGQR